jgi:hypothetical protein
MRPSLAAALCALGISFTVAVRIAGLYPIVTSQYSSTTLYQVSYHNYSVAVF